MAPDRWTEIERLYHAALHRNPADRIDFLNGACQDEDLRREVASLLAYEHAGDELLEHPAWQSASALAGARIGSYRLEAAIGQGGMGVVYRAIHSNLHRRVALKILSDGVADASARRRFQHEAQMTSSLNHPHILAIYDAGESEGRQYLVTELVDGGTLTDWLRAEPRSWRQIVELMAGVADGLATAHEAGILHRDIKPENILVTKSGYAKLADFGVAKIVSEAERIPSRTDSGEHTNYGLVIGTVAYMSPEQASGKPVDARSDVFSFGLVLYETLSGHRAFAATTDEELLQKITCAPAEPLPEKLPAALRSIVEKALENNPERRYRHTRDLARDLQAVFREPDQGNQRPSFKLIIAAVSLILVFLAVLLFVRWKWIWPPPEPPRHTQITNFTDSARAPALCRDGQMIAFIRGGEYFQSSGQIYVKRLSDGDWKQVTNEPELKYGPVFTPDCSRVAYTVLTPGGSWDTWTVPVSGGKPTRLLSNASGLIWLSERNVVFSEIVPGSGTHMGIVTSAEDRSAERPVYFPPHERSMAHYSFASPDRKSLLVVEMDQTTSWLPCRLVSLATSENGRVGPDGACISAGWSPDGHWMYLNAEVAGAWHIWRQRFPRGTPEQITFGPTEEEGVAVAPDGQSLISSVGVRRSTIWMHTTAGDHPISSEAFAFSPKISADARRVFYLWRENPVSLTSDSIAVDRSSPFGLSGTLSCIELASGKTEQYLPGLSVFNFQISKDEKWVILSGRRRDESGIWLAPLDGHLPPRLLIRNAAFRARAGRPGDVSFGREGEVVFVGLDAKHNFLYRMKTDGSGVGRITTTPILAKFGVSPDGEWVAALVPTAGRKSNWETVALHIHGTDVKKICPFLCVPQWSADMKYLYLSVDVSGTSSTGKTFVVPLRTGGPLPPLQDLGVTSRDDLLRVPGVRVIDQSDMTPGPDPSTYVFAKREFQANLFRISLR